MVVQGGLSHLQLHVKNRSRFRKAINYGVITSYDIVKHPAYVNLLILDDPTQANLNRQRHAEGASMAEEIGLLIVMFAKDVMV